LLTAFAAQSEMVSRVKPHEQMNTRRSLDHLVRPLQERRRDRQAEGLGGLEVDDEVEPIELLNRQISGVAALLILAT